MNKVILVSVFLMLLIPYATAASLKGGYVVCLSEDLYDEYVTATIKEGEPALNYVFNNGCTIAKAGLKISVLDWSWTGVSKVRLYLENDAIVLWTAMENINRDQ
ncbi:MAG: hypothetical protein O7D86_03380 [Proteobacteria bacterium]|nr:hypothetical protein [Pseudomonadota bacterium]